MTVDRMASPMKANERVAPSSGLAQGVIGLTHELRDLAHDQLELATLETRLTVTSVLTMAVIAIVMAVLVVSAWLALAGSALFGLINLGLAPWVAMLLLVPANLLLTFLCWNMIQRRSEKLGWPATVRSLKARPPPDGGERSAR
jgi:hypothetical protein